MKKIILGAFVLLAVIGAIVFVLTHQKTEAPQPQPTAAEPATNAEQPKPAEFDKTKYSLTDPNSIWVIVNKQRPLPAGFTPSQLVAPKATLNNLKTAEENSISAVVAPSLEQMLGNASKQGLNMFLASGYRGEKLQATYFNSYAARDGIEAANKYSAKPGQSEHQTGLSFDLARTDRNCYLDICFGETAEGKWLAENTHTYGFIIRYPNGKEPITGYQYEPWHLRYVGKELASELKKTNQTLEEFFSIN